MKKIVSLLVAIALILSMSATAFAVTGGFQDEPVVIESLEGGFEMTAGTNWNDADVFFKYVATKDGTIMTDAASGVWFSVNDAYDFKWGESDGETSVEVVAGDTLYINFANTTPSTITANLYYEGDEPTGGNSGNNPGGEPGGNTGSNTPTGIPSGSALALGNNDVSITYAMMPMQAPYWTYTAADDGYLSVTVSSINGNSMLDMAFGRGLYTLVVGETDGMGTNTATVYLNAGDSVNIAVLDTLDEMGLYFPAVINLEFTAGEPVVEQNPADSFNQDGNGNYVIESLANPVEIFSGNNDITFIYTAESAGVVTVTPTVDGMTATNCWISHNDNGWDTSAAPVTVAAGDVVLINIWSGYEGTVTLTPDGESGGGSGETPDGGDAPAGVPSGSALALGNNNVSITYAMMPMQAPYWTYTATEAGYLTVTVASIDGNTMLDMAFGRGMYTLVVGETDGMGTNTATVYLNAGDSVNIAVLDTLDEMGIYVPAVINLAFSNGEPAVEKNPADFFEQDADNNYVIESLAEPVEIFVGNDDIYYTYTVEFDGVLSVEPTDPANSNIWYFVNGENNYGVAPDSVAAGDVILLNVWNGYEGTVTLTPDGESGGGSGETPDGGEGEGGSGSTNEPLVGTATAGEDFKYTVQFTSDFNGTLTITVGDGTANWVSDVMDMSSFTVIPGLSGNTEGTYTVDITANTTYYVRIYGQGEPCGAISNVPYSIAFTPSGSAVGPQKEEYVVGQTEITAAGVYDLTVDNDAAETTLYVFEPTETGVYKIELTGGNVTMSQWSTIMYSENAGAVENGVMSVSISSVGQSIFIGLSGEETAAQVTITKTGDASDEPSYQITVYENKVKPSKFDSSAYTVTGSVNIEDSKVDTAVLGTDGYYHLNSADGEILYVDFKDSTMSLTSAWGYGSTSYAAYGPDGELTYVIVYQDALAEYLQAEVKDGNYTYGNTYYPLTADLIEMLKNIGSNNGWYGENGLVGSTEDAWMFACVTMSGGTTGDQGNTGNQGGNTGNEGGNTGNQGGNNAQTGDFGVIAAAIAMGVSAICGTAVIAKKKEN